MDKQLSQLESLLQQQIVAHGQLADATRQKLAALRRADHRQVAALTGQENSVFQGLGELEKQRLLLVAQLTQLIDPQAPRPLRLAELAQRLPEPVRSRLLVLRQQLTGRIEESRREAAVTRKASETLLRHMQGLMQTVGAALTGVGVYGQGGGLPKAATAVSTFSATA